MSIEYESSDGELRAESQKQWYALVETVGTLNDWFINRPDVFIAGDLLVYYRMNDNRSLLFRRNFHIRPILLIFDWGDTALAFLISPNITAWQSVSLNPVSEIATIGGLSEMAQGFIVITVYALVLGGAAFALFLRRDIAGARGG